MANTENKAIVLSLVCSDRCGFIFIASVSIHEVTNGRLGIDHIKHFNCSQNCAHRLVTV